jgi:hypothetical protein
MTDKLNGSVDLAGAAAAAAAIPNPVQAAIITFLEQLMVGAKAGQITSIGVVMVGGPSTYFSHFIGTNAAELNIGIDSLKHKLLDAVEGRQNQQSVQSRIIRAHPI